MKLSNEDRLSASITVRDGDIFKRGNVLLFPLLSGEYCAQKIDGPISNENRIITQSWSQVLSAFEHFLGD